LIRVQVHSLSQQPFSCLNGKEYLCNLRLVGLTPAAWERAKRVNNRVNKVNGYDGLGVRRVGDCANVEFHTSPFLTECPFWCIIVAKTCDYSQVDQ
jgi:hypothetical protein